ncbi:MAG: ATP-binding protein [Ignavibacteria bacterium]|nr:ATP-binding protein [Ignavibacteria bacterium]
MIEKIHLKFGPSLGKPPLEIDVTPITVFVGPNNSGKSKILREIQHTCVNGTTNNSFLLIENIVFHDIVDHEREINKIKDAVHKVKMNDDGTYRYQRNGSVSHEQLVKVLSKRKDLRDSQFCIFFVEPYTIFLDGTTRLSLVTKREIGDLRSPQNTFALLFKDDVKRKEVRRIAFEAFYRYFVIDPTNSGHLIARFSDIEPPDSNFEKSLSNDAIQFYSDASLIDSLSDGVKAYTGIIVELIAGDPRIILIDEPEAFLHPSLSSKLGKEVSLAVQNNNKNLIVSTHSANFLMGCIQSGTPINIVRLTYYNNIGTARLLPSDKVAKLMRHPLLRSIGALNGLFYDYVIVAESDSDRAFYQEINERLLRYDQSRGIPNCLFLNAQNKQTIKDIMLPLREMGIPCAAIVDIDIIKDGGQVWTKFLENAFVPAGTVRSFSTHRSEINNKFVAANIDFKIHGGIDVLNTNDKQSANDLFDQLELYGIFTVRKGELESWLKSLNSPGHGSNWLIDIFEKMGEDPTSSSYIKPDAGDVWDFIGSIKKWFVDPNKKGIPE